MICLSYAELLSETLFIYGTLIDQDVQYELLGQHLEMKDALLTGYHRFCIAGETYPAIASQTDSSTPGKLCYPVTPEMFEVLDRYEDVASGLYRRAIVQVKSGGALKVVQTYVAGPGLQGRLYGTWTSPIRARIST